MSLEYMLTKGCN